MQGRKIEVQDALLGTSLKFQIIKHSSFSVYQSKYKYVKKNSIYVLEISLIGFRETVRLPSSVLVLVPGVEAGHVGGQLVPSATSESIVRDMSHPGTRSGGRACRRPAGTICNHRIHS